MATQSLYRRYRPRRFGELKGQEHVVLALRSAVAEGREGQAYLFSGPRGTGKTTSARILAKVLNCERPVDGEPCCECESCLAVERGTSYDVHELDAASNNGVDAMRDLIEKASLGTPGRHKVYILDEVHMLSKAAEAALLKTLEEPPPHVVFVLATTDPQKMSDTIRSRTQHLQFHLLPADTLAEHVRWVADDAGLEVTEAAVNQVLEQGGGSARDTLSALELVANAGDGTIDVVPFDEYVEAMIERDAGSAMTMVARAIALGRDPRTLTEELIGYLRNGFLSLMAPELVQLPSDRVDEVAGQAQRLGAPALVRAIEQLGTVLVEMRHAPDPRVLLDVVTAQLTSDAAATDVAALLTRLHRVEARLDEFEAAPPSTAATTERAQLGARARRAVDAGTADPPAAEPDAAEPALAERPAPTDTAATDVEASSSAPPTEALTIERWENEVRPGLRGMAKAVFMPAQFVSSAPGSLTLSLPNPTHRDKCEQQRGAVEAALRDVLGVDVAVDLIVGGHDDPGGGERPPRVERDAAPAAPSSPAPAPSTPSTSGETAGAAPSGARAATHVDAHAAAPADVNRPVITGQVVPAADEDVDLDDLVDAPPETVKTPLDRLAEAFPGSELIEERVEDR